MAYLRTIVRGTLGTVEVWSTGLTWRIFGISTDVPDQALVDAILAQLIANTTTVNVPTELRALLSTNASINGWRVELRGEDERILSVAEGVLASAVNGTGTPSKTPQDAVVCSLRTTTPGPRGRGRMYWPAIGATLNTSYQLSAPTPATLVAAFRTWIRSIGDGVNAAFASLGYGKTVEFAVRSITDHQSRFINLLQVGSVLDTQRRRRDAIPESYQPLVYPGT